MFQFESNCRRRPVSQLKEGRVGFFVLSRPSVDWLKTAYVKDSNLLYSVYQLKCECPLDTLTQTHPELQLVGCLGTLDPCQVDIYN